MPSQLPAIPLLHSAAALPSLLRAAAQFAAAGLDILIFTHIAGEMVGVVVMMGGNGSGVIGCEGGGGGATVVVQDGQAVAGTPGPPWSYSSNAALQDRFAECISIAGCRPFLGTGTWESLLPLLLKTDEASMVVVVVVMMGAVGGGDRG